VIRALVVALLVALGIAASASRAYAYPQLQLVKDQTCSDCHLSPAGGGLLRENGFAVAQAMSALGDDATPFWGKLGGPAWLAWGGDLRAAAGYDGGTNHRTVVFPMQAELSAAATVGHLSLQVTAGLRDPQYQNTAATLFGSREHWLQWQQHDGSPDGLFVRVGRFLPVFGLRFAEHPAFTRRYGGTPLYGEAYGAAVEYIDPAWEVHATGFVHDPILPDSIERGNGATLYAEARLTPATSLGVEGKLDVTPDDHKEYAGITAKHVAGDLVLQAEAQFIHQKVVLGGQDAQGVGYVMASYTLPFGILVDLGLEAYAPDVHVRYLDQEGADLNVHWFASAHVELVLLDHFQMQELGEGGPSSGYALLQLHYRL
jgi:hypothetical protein